MKTFVGFGFGAIQAGLFIYEADASGNFDRYVVAEVVQEVVDAIRASGGSYHVNVATKDGIVSRRISGVEVVNPLVEEDRLKLIEEIAAAEEIATALPSVDLYTLGNSDGSVAGILAQGLNRKMETNGPAAVVYTAENNNHAAEVLEKAVKEAGGACDRVQYLDTVIGKMSGIVTDPAEIAQFGLIPVVEGLDRAFLVEEFNRILVSEVTLPGYERGITVFGEKPDLLPFEEAKLYGHNATHALLGFLLKEKGGTVMSEAADDPLLVEYVRSAFIEESGGALCRKYAGIDPLFAPEGYRLFVDDLIERMLNPYLNDTVERVTRDPKRKLGWDDRLVGTIRMALSQGMTPSRYAVGARAALRSFAEETGKQNDELAAELWGNEPESEISEVMNLVNSAEWSR